jgi:riboflavin kinase/FMN adenylyltransferase
LQQSANVHGYQLGTLEDFEMGGQRVSSTRVREALEGGDLDTATALLGRPYSMCGRVAHGDKRGRTIGFPTANIYLHRASAPVSGVFAVEMLGIDTVPIPGVANVGTRPTVDGIRALLEVHLFDFDRDIYGRHVQVRFVKKLREERKFESFEHLKQQILLDSGQARACFPD